MKSFKRRGVRGPKLKFEPGELALYWGVERKLPIPLYVVIVDHKADVRGRGTYRFLRLIGKGSPHRRYGPAIWGVSSDLDRIEGRPKADTSRRIWNVNKRIKQAYERGCQCNCCPHVAVRPSHVRRDGTFKWDVREGVWFGCRRKP